jgi:hypothetical protein
VFTVHRTPDPALPQDAQDAVRREYRSLGWIVLTALAQCPPAERVYYDQVAQIEMPGWSQGRVTLVGYACQAVSLLAGQGARRWASRAPTCWPSTSPAPTRSRTAWRVLVAQHEQFSVLGPITTTDHHQHTQQPTHQQIQQRQQDSTMVSAH